MVPRLDSRVASSLVAIVDAAKDTAHDKITEAYHKLMLLNHADIGYVLYCMSYFPNQILSTIEVSMPIIRVC